MVLLQRKLYFSKDPEGVQHFPGGVQLFFRGGGVQMLISIETHITCDFPGRDRTLYTPSGSAHANCLQKPSAEEYSYSIHWYEWPVF